jgi:sugar lactone lactonase YvrE
MIARLLLRVSLLSMALCLAPRLAGRVETVAGTGEAGFAGDGGPAAQARLQEPFGVEIDARGDLYVADMANQRVRRVDARTGKITTVAGSGAKGYRGDGGPATAAALNEPYGLALARDGSFFIVDRLNACVRRVDGKSGRIETVAGTGTPGYNGDGGPGTRAQLREPNGLALRGDELYIADVADQRVRRLDLKQGTITTFAGTGRRATSGDNGPARDADLNGPRAVTLDRAGNLYIVEREGNRVRRVERQSGTITTVAGTGATGYAGDGGPARQATFNGPKWICTDRDDNLYVVDTENHCVRRIDARTGRIDTVLGGTATGQQPGGSLDRPHGACVDRRGTLYVADSSHHRVLARSPATGRG